MAINSVTQLQEQVGGTILLPDHPDYHRTRRGWNLTTDHYPAVILVASSVQDIQTGIHFARETGLGIAIQSTGHGIQQPADDALLIVTSQLKGVRVDVEARTARVEAGVIWEEVLHQATPHGLAPLLGSSPHVGVIGYTLGGGIGWLARKYGLAADSVRRIDIVTPDGELRHTSPTENSELFWGLRGGGGNFGVVTTMEFDLYPVAALYGGNMVYPGDLAGEALRFFREWVKTAPEELTSSIQILKIPSLPGIPPQLQGKVQVILRAAYTGNPREGEALIQKWLDWCPPVSSDFHELPFSDVATISNDPVDPSPGYGSNETLADLSDTAIDIMVRHATNPPSPLAITELRHAGGAITRVPADANAVSNRDAVFFLQIAGPAPTPELLTAMKAAIHDYKDDLRPHVRGGVYLNFMKGEEAAERGADAYLPQTHARLVALKQQYDPQNLFRFSYQLVAP